MRRAAVGAILGSVALASAGAAAAGAEAARITNPAALANACVTLASGRAYAAVADGGYAIARRRAAAARLFLKPTGIGTYMLRDEEERLMALRAPAAIERGEVPGPAAEWELRRARRRTFTLRSALPDGGYAGFNADGELDAGRRARFAVRRARGCRPFPEAGLGARGRSFRGTRRDGSVLGYADLHMHVTADLRGGGLVIAGRAFDRFGVTEALGRDAEVHGDDGSLDFTGNLLRAGTPTGTHDTDGWPTFAGWPQADTYTHQQAYWRWLERAWRSGLRLLGAQLVEDEPLCNIEPRRSHSCDETATIALEVRRLRELEDYVDAQYGGRGRGWLRLVYGPRQARRAVERGKLAVVIGVESSNPFGCALRGGQPQCTRAEIDAGIALLRRLGVRTVFPAHWVDNALAGAALEGGDKGTFIAGMQLSYTGAPFATGACPYPEQGEPGPLGGGRECNSRGLSELGDYALRRLMDAQMLIEADHLSEWARQRALAIAEERRYPLVSSHTGTGGLWTAEELRRLYAVGGMAAATLDDAAGLPDEVLALGGYRAANRTVGVGLASDTGGFNALPGPQPGPAYPFRPYRGRVRFDRQRSGTRTFDLTRDGMAHYGLLPDLLAAVADQPRGRAALGLLYRSAEAYLEMWERAVAAR